MNGRERMRSFTPAFSVTCIGYIFRHAISRRAMLAYVKNERSTTLKFDLSCKSGNMQSPQINLLQPFEVSNYHLFVIFVSLITGNIVSCTVKRSFSRLHTMSKDGMSKDGRKMSPMHVTLKAGVSW